MTGTEGECEQGARVAAAHKRDFDQGVLWAAARMVEIFDQPTMAAELLQQSGADISLTDGADLPCLQKALEERVAP